MSRTSRGTSPGNKVLSKQPYGVDLGNVVATPAPDWTQPMLDNVAIDTKVGRGIGPWVGAIQHNSDKDKWLFMLW